MTVYLTWPCREYFCHEIYLETAVQTSYSNDMSLIKPIYSIPSPKIKVFVKVNSEMNKKYSQQNS